MDVFQILEELETTSSSKQKIAILAVNKDNVAFVAMLDAALNFQRKFFVKKFNDNSGYSGPEVNMHFSFLEVLTQLETRAVTGNAAIALIEDLMIGCSARQVKWYARIIRKDLKCNFGISSCQKAGIDIPEFEVMLAKDGKDCKKVGDIVKQGVYVSKKLDGYRLFAVCDHGEVSMLSRNGTDYENFPTIKMALSKLSANSRFVLDGEVMSDDFNKMQQTAFASKRGTTVGDVQYHVFGWVPFEEWETSDFVMKSGDRIEQLCYWFNSHQAEIDTNAFPIVRVEHQYTNSLNKIYELEAQFITEGYEGAMALPNIPYYLGKKSNKLLKFKTFVSQDCKIVGIYLGEPDKKYAHTMGGFKVIQENGKSCDVGGGYSDADRDCYWTNQSDYIGKIIECKYQELTPDGIMRFPVFIRWRNDKSDK